MKNISKILKLYKAGYFSCYRSDPDPLKKVPDPDPAGQKSPDPHPCMYHSNNIACKRSKENVNENRNRGVFRRKDGGYLGAGWGEGGTLMSRV